MVCQDDGRTRALLAALEASTSGVLVVAFEAAVLPDQSARCVDGTTVGRGKDLVISGGLNIYPREVEMLVDDLPGVLESAVIGVPQPDFGDAVVAVVVPRPGATLDPGALAGAMADRIARFKQPKRIVVADELPRNAMGKVQKAALRETHRAMFA